jgi:FkbM family methyltransferase
MSSNNGHSQLLSSPTPGKRVLWYSNAPYAPTGYGNQTGLVCAYLPQFGHPMAVLANYGLQGTKLEIGGVKIYPQGRDGLSNDIVQAMADDWEADVILTLYDAWPLNFKTLPGHHTPWVAWVPIDHETVQPPLVESLRRADGVVAYSKHGQAALQAAGFDAAYIPHGVETKTFNPGSQNKARAAIGFPEDVFMVGMVAANKGYPSRKCLPEALMAFRQFHEEYPNALLYLHTRTDESNGVDIDEIIKSLGLERAVLLCDQFQLQLGYPAPYMVDLYRAFDCLLNPSRGEGFGIPILESLACGTPVIATDTTAMSELVGFDTPGKAPGYSTNGQCGWLVEGEPFWSSQGAWQRVPRVDEITRALAEACEMKAFAPVAWLALQDRCVARAQEYDFGTVVAPLWDAYLRSEVWKPELRQAQLPRVSVITPWRDHPELIPLYERAVQGADEVIVVDNGSDGGDLKIAEQLAEMCHRLGAVYVRHEENHWFSRACNEGADKATGDILLFLNNDIAAPPGWIDQLRKEVRPGALYGPSKAFAPVDGFDVPYIEGWCLAVRRDDWESLQGFDEFAYARPYYEDTDLSFRAVEEWKLRLVETDWPVIHLGETTTRSTPGALDSAETNRETFLARVREARQGQPIFRIPRPHVHQWPPTGLYAGEGICVPCKDPSCSAGLMIAQGSQKIIEGFFPMAVYGLPLDIEDDPDGGVAKIICKEIEHAYRLDEIDFRPGDVVLDIGAHVGIVSIYLAKKHPGLRIIAFEPVKENYERLLRNIRANGVQVGAVNWALTGDGLPVSLGGDLHQNSGGMSILKGDRSAKGEGIPVFVKSVTLAEAFEIFGVQQAKLLKIDCEGAEYEVLGAMPELLSRVEYLRGEFHDFPGGNPDELEALCRQFIPAEKVRVSVSKIQIDEPVMEAEYAY